MESNNHLQSSKSQVLRKEETQKELAYQDKLKSPEYRHVNKKTYGNKKYYYTVVSNYTPSSNEANAAQTKGPMVEITMKSGSKYYGEVNDKNEREGFGRYEVVNAGLYEGFWRRGFRNGQGKFWNKKNVLQYEGEWECGEPHGWGKVFNQWGYLKYQGILNKGKVKGGRYWSDYKNIR